MWHKTNKISLTCTQNSAYSFLKRFAFPAHRRPLTLHRELLTFIFTNRTYFCTTGSIAFAICHCRAGTSTTHSCTVSLGSDRENLPTYSACSLEDTPSSARAPQNAISKRDGRGGNHAHALHWLGIGWGTGKQSWSSVHYLEISGSTPAYHCQYYITALGQPDQFSSCHWTRGQLSSTFPPVLFICRMFRKCVLHTALFLTKTYAFKAAYNHIQLRNAVW